MSYLTANRFDVLASGKVRNFEKKGARPRQTTSVPLQQPAKTNNPAPKPDKKNIKDEEPPMAVTLTLDPPKIDLDAQKKPTKVDERAKKEEDRKTDRSVVRGGEAQKQTNKKGGAGKANWGDDPTGADTALKTEESIARDVAEEKAKETNEEDAGTPTDSKEAKTDKDKEEKKEEVVQKTVDEYLKEKAAKKEAKAQQKREVDNSGLKKFQVLKRDEDEEKAAAPKKDQKKEASPSPQAKKPAAPEPKGKQTAAPGGKAAPKVDAKGGKAVKAPEPVPEPVPEKKKKEKGGHQDIELLSNMFAMSHTSRPRPPRKDGPRGPPGGRGDARGPARGSRPEGETTGSPSTENENAEGSPKGDGASPKRESPNGDGAAPAEQAEAAADVWASSTPAEGEGNDGEWKADAPPADDANLGGRGRGRGRGEFRGRGRGGYGRGEFRGRGGPYRGGGRGRGRFPAGEETEVDFENAFPEMPTRPSA